MRSAQTNYGYASAAAIMLVAQLGLSPALAANCAAGWSDQGGGLCEKILNYNGSTGTIGTIQLVTVPAAVTAMTMIVAGAAGQDSFESGDGPPAAGGKGGRQTGTITVVPGDSLRVYVGESGASVPVAPVRGWQLPDLVNPGAYFISGAFGGGGLSSSSYCGFGGGASFVFDGQPIPGDPGGAIGNLLIAAGGGGGGGYDGNQFVSHGATGAQKNTGGAGAGAAAATPGTAVGLMVGLGGSGYSPGAGGGASLLAGGTAGLPAIPGNYGFGQQPGGPGMGPATLPDATNPAYTALYLGAGGNSAKGSCCYYYGFGGGGGGGYYGGGAGGTIDAELAGGGGGGGSGYIAANATGALAETGIQSGHGRVTLRYHVPLPPTITGFAPTSGPVGSTITIAGTNFAAVTQVAVNGHPATFAIDSPTQLRAKVPMGATSGKVTVTNALDVATSAATFTITVVPLALAVSTGGTGGGSVTSSPAGIDCGATCTANFSSGTAVTLTAHPDAASTFGGWGGDCAGTGECIVPMDGTKSVTANFENLFFAVTSGIDPSAVGQMVVFTATASTPGLLPAPTGTVDFRDGTATLCATVPVAGDAATCTVDTLPAGARSITAVYSGDGNYPGSTSPAYTQTVVDTAAGSLTVTPGGTGSGTVTSVPPGIDCGADCTEPCANPMQFTLTATPAAGSVFMGWLGACTGNDPCVANASGAVAVSATFAPDTVLPRIDIDGNTHYDALTDGLLILRHLLGQTGDALTTGAVGAGPARSGAAEIAQYIENIRPLLDVDGNGQVDALTDGLLLLRYLFGIRGEALVAGATGPGATRTTGQIESWIQAIVP